MSNNNMPFDKTPVKQSTEGLLKDAREQEKLLVGKSYRRGDSWKLGDKFLREMTLRWNVKPGDTGKRLLLLRKLLKEENTKLISGLMKDLPRPIIPYGSVPYTSPEDFLNNEIDAVIDAFIKEEARIIQSTTISMRDVQTCSERNIAPKLEEMKSRLPFKKAGLASVYELSGKTYIPTKNNALISSVKRKIKELKESLSQKVNIFTSKNWWIKEFNRYVTSMAAFELWNIAHSHFATGDMGFGFGFKTSCVIGGLPLRHISSIEVARSGKILKFRADGSIFLAQQHGGEDAIKIEFKILRTELWMFLVIWALFLFGNGELKEIPLIGAEQKNVLVTIKKLMDTAQYDKQLKNPSYTFHRTFPLITRNIIIPNVYIETFSFEENVNQGLDSLRCSLMLRTYREPLDPPITKIEGDNVWVGFDPNKSLRMYETIEFSANLAWRMYNFGKTIIVGKSLIGNEGLFNTASDDVYYNIDPLDIAASVGLAVVGYKLIK